MNEMRGDRHEHGLNRVRIYPGNASKWILAVVEELMEEFQFPVTGFDAGNWSEFINLVVREHACYRRYDTTEERDLLKRLWRLVSPRTHFLTPTSPPTRHGH